MMTRSQHEVHARCGSADMPAAPPGVAARLLALAAFAAFAALLAGCAATAPVPPARDAQALRVVVPPQPVAPQQLQRLVDAALAQWRRWGSARIGFDADGAWCREHDGSCESIDDGCGDEQSPALCPVVDEYWRATPPFAPRHDCRMVDVCAVHWPQYLPTLRTPAWSAAFVSAMMRAAGFDSTQFRPADQHAQYVVAAREGWISAYALRALPAAPQEGDLLCMARSGAAALRLPSSSEETSADSADASQDGEDAITGAGSATNSAAAIPALDLAMIRADWPATPMHCDIVVQVDRAAGRVDAIGGNVQQGVARISVPLEPDGTLRVWPADGRRWTMLMQARRMVPASAAAIAVQAEGP